MKQKVLEVRESWLNVPKESHTLFLTYHHIKKLCLSGKIIRYFRYYHQVSFYLEESPKYRYAFQLGLISYFLSKKPPLLKYTDNQTVKVSLPFLIKRSLLWAYDLLHLPLFLHFLKKEIHSLKKGRSHPLNLSHTPYYFRTDFHFNLKQGGSVGHIAGVLNNLEGILGKSPILLTSDKIPTVSQTIASHTIAPEDIFLGLKEYPTLAFAQTFFKKASSLLEKTAPSFIYERYSSGSLSGATLSQKFHVPFVLEYNGSEVWIGKNWGKPYRLESRFLEIEMVNLKLADLIVVVSTPLKEELIDRGIEEGKILVNPNGVDPRKYSPSIDGKGIRTALKLEGKTCIGFIGTFGKWHGAEVLAKAFALLLKKYPEYNHTLHLMMIGAGPTMEKVQNLIQKESLKKSVTLTGAIPQEKAPSYLAACDILASPHVPNSDGTKFFGSPTKLFEYMAMGKGIVASDLEQIGEVLKHEKTAYLVKPGDPLSLMLGLKALVDNPKLRETLGDNARQEVLKNYTWKKHTQRIITKLKAQCPQN